MNPVPALVTVLGPVVQTLVIYACLVLSISTVGRQQIAQLALADYVIVALLGSAVETGLYQGGGSFWAGLVSAVTLLLANRAFRFAASHSAFGRRFLRGTPLLLVHNGRIQAANLSRAHLTEQNLMTAIRMRGYDRLDQVRYAVAEPNGSIGVVPRKESQSRPA